MLQQATRGREIYDVYHVLRTGVKYPTDLRLLEEYAHLIKFEFMKKADFGFVTPSRSHLTES